MNPGTRGLAWSEHASKEADGSKHMKPGQSRGLMGRILLKLANQQAESTRDEFRVVVVCKVEKDGDQIGAAWWECWFWYHLAGLPKTSLIGAQ